MHCTVNFSSNEKPLFPPSVNDEDLREFFQKVASNVFGIDGVKDTQPLMGSEDFAYFQDLIPGYFFLRMKDDSMKHNPLPTFTAFCEDGLTYEAAMHALLVVRYPLERQIEPHVLTGDSKDEL